MEIKGILVTIIAPMSDHIANGGEKILGNASSIKVRPDGRVYISGQKQRHALFSAIERLNFEDGKRNGTRRKTVFLHRTFHVLRLTINGGTHARSKT